jgi:hypothetical protein
MSDKENEFTYKNDAGEEIYTSTYLRNRGTCCKTNCLHCPYGYTLKNYSIELFAIEEKYIKYANEIIRDTKPVELCSLSLSILAEGFGKKDKVTAPYVTLDNFNNFAFGLFKGEVCAVIEYSTKLSESTSGRRVKELYLKKEFQDQGLGKEYIIK